MKSSSSVTAALCLSALLAAPAFGQPYVDRMVVLDRSAHMTGGGRMVAAQNATNLFIDLSRNNDGLGVVPYHTMADASFFTLRRVTTVPNVRRDAENYVDALNTGNLSSFADGLVEAVNELNFSPTGNAECAILMLSSDEQTASPEWSGVRNGVVNSGCPVHAVAQGEIADHLLLQQVASETGGRFFYSEDEDAPPNDLAYSNLSLGDVLEHAFMRSMNWSRLLQERGAVPEFRSEFELPPDQVHTVFVDDSIESIVFTLDWHSINEPDCDNSQVSNGCFGKDLALTLLSPNGNRIDPNQLDYTFEDIVSGHVGWRIQNPEPGLWTLVVNADSFYVWYDLEYQVIVSAATTIEPELRLADARTVTPVTGDSMHIELDVAAHETLSGTFVAAEVTEPGGTRMTIPLCDDGLHGDGAAGDGLFAGQYRRFNMNADQAIDPGPHQVRTFVLAGDIRREALGAFVARMGTSTTPPPALDLLFASSFEAQLLSPGAACASN